MHSYEYLKVHGRIMRNFSGYIILYQSTLHILIASNKCYHLSLEVRLTVGDYPLCNEYLYMYV